MALKKVLGLVATSAGRLLLAVAAIELALVFYYRPTLEYEFFGEYGYAGGQPRPAPYWLTGELIGGVFGALLGTAGGVLLWAGRRWHRR